MKKLKTMNRWRKVFCMGPKELEWEDAEGMEEDMGTVVNGEMKHVKHRRYEVAVRFGEREERMVVTGTRKYSKAKKTGTKGFALSLKVSGNRYFGIEVLTKLSGDGERVGSCSDCGFGADFEGWNQGE